MAENPPVAAADEVLRKARPLQGPAVRGPRTPEGKEISSANATIHGLCRDKRTIADQAEIRLIRDYLIAGCGPEAMGELANIERAADALFMWNKCHRTIQGLAIRVIEKHRTARRQPFQDQIAQLEASLDIWEDVLTQRFPLGKGYGGVYPILLRDIDPTARSPKALINPTA